MLYYDFYYKNCLISPLCLYVSLLSSDLRDILIRNVTDVFMGEIFHLNFLERGGCEIPDSCFLVNGREGYRLLPRSAYLHCGCISRPRL